MMPRDRAAISVQSVEAEMGAVGPRVGSGPVGRHGSHGTKPPDTATLAGASTPTSPQPCRRRTLGEWSAGDERWEGGGVGFQSLGYPTVTGCDHVSGSLHLKETRVRREVVLWHRYRSNGGPAVRKQNTKESR
jgi:hypothetical protein